MYCLVYNFSKVLLLLILILFKKKNINRCLEGGAEGFLLKPVKLSDLSKLHSHLLMNGITHDDDDDDDSICTIEKTNFIIKEDGENETNCSSNTNKRKATTSDASDRRPRVQELILPAVS